MAAEDIAAALQRVESVLQRRPDVGLHDDAPATARWEGNTRVVSTHANGARLSTDMPGELGGTGDQVTPGWLFRAGLAACATTSIALAAIAEGVAIDLLEIRASSKSDTRGILGMAGADGEPVHAGPQDLKLEVRIGASGVSADRLRTLVQQGIARSPVPGALRGGTPLALLIDVDAA